MARSLDEIASRLAAQPPALESRPARMRAAVSLVLREADGDLEALFIRRARHDADPWSGHLAFPGGRLDEIDATARAAAERETREEVGIDLTNRARVRALGRLEDVFGHAESIRVSAFVYGLEVHGPLRPNYEVDAAFWSPLDHCTDPARQAVREFTYLERKRPLPTIRLLDEADAPVLWGITYKFMDDFMSRIGRPIPFMPWEADTPG